LKTNEIAYPFALSDTRRRNVPSGWSYRNSSASAREMSPWNQGWIFPSSFRCTLRFISYFCHHFTTAFFCLSRSFLKSLGFCCASFAAWEWARYWETRE
jgi:hypothetical protein